MLKDADEPGGVFLAWPINIFFRAVMSRQPRPENDAWAAEAIYTERGPGVIRREPAAHRAGRLDGGVEGRKEGRKEEGRMEGWWGEEEGRAVLLWKPGFRAFPWQDCPRIPSWCQTRGNPHQNGASRAISCARELCAWS